MPENPEEVRAMAIREAAAVRQGMLEDSGFLQASPTVSDCGGGSCKGQHQSNDGAGEG